MGGGLCVPQGAERRRSFGLVEREELAKALDWQAGRKGIATNHIGNSSAAHDGLG
jgi:hypothetical protein